MNKIGLLTSGGDAPGMNPAIRAVVRTAVFRGVEVIGIEEGFDGCVRGEMKRLRERDVGGILQRGGTILQTARCPEFLERKGRLKAVRELNEEGIEGLVIIGGDGSMRGANALIEMGFPVVGVPASIDNDMWGTNMSIGVDTAMNTIMDAVDKLRDTASSHQRVFIIETMGRNCGYLALMAGIICGAEIVLIPEVEISMEELGAKIEDAYARGKAHAVIVAAEGASLKSDDVATFLREIEIEFEVRVTILGHVQRGGSPSAFDRMLATRLGVKAADALLEGETGVMVGLQGRDIVTVPLTEVVSKSRKANLAYYEMAEMLAR
jgi:6-phosphofructokinase 1